MAGKFEITKSKSDKFLFNLKAGNGQVILTSMMFETLADAQKGIAAVISNSKDDGQFERKTASDNSPYFVLKNAEGKVAGKSEMYSSVSGMENGITSVKTNSQDSVIKDLSAG